MEDRNIIMPTKAEKENSIQAILNRVELKNDTRKHRLLTPFKELPMSIILSSSLTVKFLSIVMIFIYIVTLENMNHYYEQQELNFALNVVVLLFSPFIFFIHLIDLTKSFSNNVYNLELTLKYRFHQIIGYKFIVLTFISLLINGVVILSYPNIHFITGSITVLSSILITTSFIYTVVFKFKTPIIPVMLIILWTLLNITLLILIDQYELTDYYNHYKVFIYGVGLILGIILHVIQFKTVFKGKSERWYMGCLN